MDRAGFTLTTSGVLTIDTSLLPPPVTYAYAPEGEKATPSTPLNPEGMEPVTVLDAVLIINTLE